MSAHIIRVAGIDPGASTGVVVLQLPTSAPTFDNARWVHSARLTAAGATRSRTDAEGRALLFSRVRDFLIEHRVQYVAIERPADAMPMWSPGSGRAKGVGRGTMFALGENYGLCLAAACAVTGMRRVQSYPVTTSAPKAGKTQRMGWMPGTPQRPWITQKREITLAELRELATSLRARPHDGIIRPLNDPPGEDELMALGVLRYHLARQPISVAPA